MTWLDGLADQDVFCKQQPVPLEKQESVAVARLETTQHPEQRSECGTRANEAPILLCCEQ